MADDRALFVSAGLEGALKQIESNPALGASTRAALAAAGLAESGCERGVGNLIFTVAGALNDTRAHRRDAVARMIGAGELVTASQVSAAIDFFKKRTPDAAVVPAELAAACGAGIRFTEAQLAGKVRGGVGLACATQAARARCCCELWLLSSLLHRTNASAPPPPSA